MSVHIFALAFEGLSIPSTIFDTGKHGLGLRITIRDVHTKHKLFLSFKHAAQFSTISGRKFRKLVGIWVNAGTVKGRKGVVRTSNVGLETQTTWYPGTGSASSKAAIKTQIESNSYL
ncbi:uncharacterized protein [Physcomitrium patens]|uniref:uncharacterized protein isoform X2 n=1 Tax=Physcomitrium patens TaxID=3218 RepID=UPI00024AE55C|nr:uncharacterized protein LOC112287194 [Physcomitrium patens]|eukprot:XP_024385723.1 uncharacterized protein LOC112287194 [Physcomitrella patens]